MCLGVFIELWVFSFMIFVFVLNFFLFIFIYLVYLFYYYFFKFFFVINPNRIVIFLSATRLAEDGLFVPVVFILVVIHSQLHSNLRRPRHQPPQVRPPLQWNKAKRKKKKKKKKNGVLQDFVKK